MRETFFTVLFTASTILALSQPHLAVQRTVNAVPDLRKQGITLRQIALHTSENTKADEQSKLTEASS